MRPLILQESVMTSNTFGLNRSIGLAIAAIATVSLLGTGILVEALAQLNTATTSQERSSRIIAGLDAFQAAMLNQETGVRGYLLTGRTSSLEPYKTGRPALEAAIASLEGLVHENPEQLDALRQAEEAARDWQTNIGTVIVRDMANPASQAQARAIESSGAGKRQFDRFRQELSLIEAQEQRSSLQQRHIVRQAERRANRALWASAILTLLICLGVGIAVHRMITRPLVALAEVMRRLARRDTTVEVPSRGQRNEVGAMARAVEVFKNSLIELDRTSILRVTANTMPAMVGYVDRNRNVGFLNDEFGRWFDIGAAGEVGDIQNRPLDQIFANGSFPGRTTELEQALMGNEIKFACELKPKKGAVRDIEGYFRPHRAPDGQVLGAVTLLTDVTDRKDIDQKLRRQAHDLQRSNEELEQFAYVASHDLKAPLRGIENLASWIEEDLADTLTGETRTNMDLLRSRVKRLESLLDDLLAYSRAGRADTVIRDVDTRALVGELATLISPPDGFVIEGAASLPSLTTPQAALSQVLQNLMGNAIKHHPDPARGRIWIDAERRGHQYEFRVSDNGPGIPEKYRERVFGMFQTLKPRDEVEGSGMGLAIVKKLVERQAGRVWLTDSPGGGLQVHFTWPIVARG